MLHCGRETKEREEAARRAAEDAAQECIGVDHADLPYVFGLAGAALRERNGQPRISKRKQAP